MVGGKLTLLLDRASGLSYGDIMGKTDPYVRFDLYQDNWGARDKDYGFQCSSTKSNDCNPVYGETFVWNNITELENVVLHVRVMHDDVGSRDDKVGKWNDKVGNWTIKVDDLQSPMNVDRVIDRNLILRNGMIHLKMSYKA